MLSGVRRGTVLAEVVQQAVRQGRAEQVVAVAVQAAVAARGVPAPVLTAARPETAEGRQPVPAAQGGLHPRRRVATGNVRSTYIRRVSCGQSRPHAFKRNLHTYRIFYIENDE